MPDQIEINEYKKKIASLNLDDLQDILSHINKDKVPWKYDLVSAEIESRKSGKPVKDIEIPKETPKKEEPVKEEKTEKAPEVKKEDRKPKPSLRLRKSKIGGAAPAKEEAAPEPVAEAPPPVEEEKVEEVPEARTEEKPEVSAEPEEVEAPELKEEPPEEPKEPEEKPKEEPAAQKTIKKEVPEISEKSKASMLDYLMLGAALFLLVIALYIVVIPFVELPGSGIVKSILSKIPGF